MDEMVTEIQWTRLPFVFEAELLQEDLRGIAEEEWVPHFNQKDYEGRWSSVSLRSRTGLVEDGVPMGTAAEFKDTPLMARCPHMKAAVDAFGFAKKSVRLLRLQAGSRVREHVDRDLGLAAGELRLHVPVTTNDRLEFVVAGRQLKLREGESWYIDFSQPHRIYNGGETDRVHLIIDGEANEWALAMLQRATEEMVTESFEPKGAAEFERFRALVFEDVKLQVELLRTETRDALMSAVVAAGAARGFVFEAAEVEAVLHKNTQAWNARTGEA